MSAEKPIITAIPKKVPAVLKFYKPGPFRTGDKFEVAAIARQLFKAQCFRSISNADSFSLHQAKVDDENQVSTEGSLPMIMFTSSHAEFLWRMCERMMEIRLFVEAVADADGFKCEIGGVSVRSTGDTGRNNYDREPLDVTVR